MSKIVIIDSQIAGISGDMLLSSLVDIGANKKKVVDSIYVCQDYFEGSKIRKVDFIKTTSYGISCTKLLFEYKDSTRFRLGSVVYRSIASCCDSINLSNVAKSFVLNSIKTIITAESKIHGSKHDDVRLHEVSTVDTAADLIGTAVALDNLGLLSQKFYATNVAIGNGMLQFSHGVVPNPGNAILEILRNSQILLVPGKIDGELTTPTGAAMLVNLASEHISQYPPFIPEQIGNGAGQKDGKNVANILRIVVGQSNSNVDHTSESVFEIETNVDDATGETIGNMIETLYANSAKDVTVLQGISKKNRPSFIIKVLSDMASRDSLVKLLLNETGSLGCRVHEINRITIPRSFITVPIIIGNQRFVVKVKLSKDKDGTIRMIKPEYDDIKKIATRLKIPYRKVFDIVYYEVFKKYSR
ncbi:MAG: nickel pincer cofactor biosynthesis protein LarC [Nitrososphaeraceae archaeon]|nr:nickel pincer cofactor biosynthesis protein LarC [Nitrososphaeraceae archaeon]